MAKPIATPTAFAPLAPPWSLVSLDANFTSIANALNDYSFYSNYLADTSGVANAITVNTPSGTAFAYTAGIMVQVKVAVTNTSGTVNLNVNSLGNQLVKNPDGTNPAVGQLVAAGIYTFQYDGTNFQVIGSALGFTGFANPSASVGLATVNGVATTAMRSDAAPALDQSIAPTMTGLWSFQQSLGAFSATGNPYIKLANTSASAQTPIDFFTSTSTLTGRIRNDSTGSMNYVGFLSGTHTFFVGGDSGVGTQALAMSTSTLTFGNATNNQAFNFAGTGFVTAAGFIPNGSGVPSNGLYLSGANTLGFATSSALRWSLNSVGTWACANIGTNPGLDINNSNSVVGNPPLRLFNANASAQTPIDWFSNGTLSGRIRNDFAGDMAFVAFASGAHSFFTGGDSGTGTNRFQISASAPIIQGRGPTAAALVDMTPDTGSFTGTFTGLAAATTATVSWVRIGNLIIMTMPYSGQANLSNATTFTMTGIPASIQPATAGTRGQLGYCTDNSSVIAPGTSGATFSISGGTMTFYKGAGASSWTAAGAKSIGISTDSAAQFIYYSLN